MTRTLTFAFLIVIIFMVCGCGTYLNRSSNPSYSGENFSKSKNDQTPTITLISSFDHKHEYISKSIEEGLLDMLSIHCNDAHLISYLEQDKTQLTLNSTTKEEAIKNQLMAQKPNIIFALSPISSLYDGRRLINTDYKLTIIQYSTGHEIWTANFGIDTQGFKKMTYKNISNQLDWLKITMNLNNVWGKLASLHSDK